jgi:hypothetical protein
MGRPIFLSLFLFLSGCTGGHGSAAYRAELSTLIGLKEGELVQRLGQPTSTSQSLGQKFLVYRDLDSSYVNPAAGYRYDHNDYPILAPPPSRAEFNCRTTFSLENGRVTAFDLQGIGCD